MVVKRQICFGFDSESFSYPNAFGTMQNACLGRLRELGFPLAAVGPFDIGATAYPARLHYGFNGRTAADILADLSTYVTTLAAQFTGTPGSRARPVLWNNIGINDIGANATAAATVLANNATINAAFRVAIPDLIIIRPTLVVPATSTPSRPSYATNRGIAITFNSTVTTGNTGSNLVVDIGSPELTSDGIHETDTLAGYGSVGIASANGIASLL